MEVSQLHKMKDTNQLSSGNIYVSVYNCYGNLLPTCLAASCVFVTGFQPNMKIKCHKSLHMGCGDTRHIMLSLVLHREVS